MGINISEKKLDVLKSEFTKYLINNNPNLDIEETIPTYVTDAFFPLNNDVGIDFWESLSDEESLLTLKDKIYKFLFDNRNKKTAKERADGYYAATKRFVEFLKNNHPDLLDNATSGSNHYREFKYLLKRFIEQSEKNISGAASKSTTLGSKGFEKNSFKHIRNYDCIVLNDIEYHVHLFGNASYGPKTGNGSGMLPYLGFEVDSGNWANIRVAYNDYKAQNLRVVVWNRKTKKDGTVVKEYSVSDLGLFYDSEPNDALKKLYNEYTSLRGKDRLTKNGDRMIIQKYINKLENSKNIILRGAPGTGKTYLARQMAASLIGVDINDLDETEQYSFVQFHPSYDYTDFVEGLRPITNNNGDMSFELVDGVFKKFIEGASKAKNVGTDNFEEAWGNLVSYINDNGEIVIDNSFIYSPSESWEASGGIMRVSDSGYKQYMNKSQLYKIYCGKKGVPMGGHDNYRKKVLNHMKEHFGLNEYSFSERKEFKPFVFIIDEINRGEISKIFGELFFSIDPGYRGKDGSVLTQYSNLHDESSMFYIPDNVYIIGTMNDIDRSVDSFDFAMRRRFRFIEVKSEETVSMLDDGLDKNEVEEARSRLDSLNKKIEAIDDLNRNYHIGPSYFLKLNEVGYDYDLLWEDYIKPLLEDYLRGSYAEEQNLMSLKAAFNLMKDNSDDKIEDNNG